MAEIITTERRPDWPGRCGRLEYFVEQLVLIAETYGGEHLTDQQRRTVERGRELLRAEP